MGHAPISAVDVLDEALANWPDDEATVARSGRVTYRQLDALVEQHLHTLDCSRGATGRSTGRLARQ